MFVCVFLTKAFGLLHGNDTDVKVFKLVLEQCVPYYTISIAGWFDSKQCKLFSHAIHYQHPPARNAHQSEKESRTAWWWMWIWMSNVWLNDIPMKNQEGRSPAIYVRLPAPFTLSLVALILIQSSHHCLTSEVYCLFLYFSVSPNRM